MQAEEATAKRKEPPPEEEEKDEPQDKKPKAIKYVSPEEMYGVKVSRNIVRDVCAGCLGTRNSELKEDPIVLCDGEGCGREYHLQCCIPPLTMEEIPEGSYLCIDCDPDGSSAQLETYFERCWEARSRYKTSREYVASLFDKNEAIPVSEFPRITEFHRDCIGSVKNFHPASIPQGPIGPDFLVGKPVRMYCPDGNMYHNGRILDWRRATHLKPISASSLSNASDFKYGNLNEIACCEFLVAYPAGLDYRKRTIHQWIILEEHSLAIGTSLVWAYDNRKKDWLPGQVWLRTSLELIPILERLSADEGQVIYDINKIASIKDPWALTQLFGKDSHLLLKCHDEAVDLFSPSFQHRLSKTTSYAGDNTYVDPSTMLAFQEVEERRRVRDWYKLPLQNPFHEKALSIVDEYSLPRLDVNAKDDDEIVVTSPRPCPLVRRGMDRMWIMKQLKNYGFEQSKDAAASLQLKGVKSRAGAFKKLQQQVKSGGSASLSSLLAR